MRSKVHHAALYTKMSHELFLLRKQAEAANLRADEAMAFAQVKKAALDHIHEFMKHYVIGEPKKLLDEQVRYYKGEVQDRSDQISQLQVKMKDEKLSARRELRDVKKQLASWKKKAVQYD